MKLGIVGLPNVGKSTLFNAITKAGAEAANYPFCTIEPNVGVVDVPDARLKVLADMFHSKKIVPAGMKFVDIAGLVKGASKGEGLGNKFLSHIRQTDAIAEVVRCFEDGNITHVEGSIDPVRDVEIINTELCLADLESVEKQLVKAQKLIKAGDKKAAARAALLQRISDALGEGIPVRRVEMTDDEKAGLKELDLLTSKPMSRRELEQKLRSWEAGEEEAAAIADRMEELGFLNDAAYAAQVVRYYSAKGYGERKLRDELYRRGIPRELWDEALEGAADPSAAIEEFLRKKWRGTLPDDPRELKKASDALARRGFRWEDIKDGLRRHGGAPEEEY